jgi:hypothetical protein
MSLKSSQTNWTAAIVILIFVGIGGYFLSSNVNVQEKGQIADAAVTHNEQVKKIKASVLINPGDKQSKLLSAQEVAIEEGKTALDLTKSVAKVKTKGEGQDAFVTSINGKAADSAKKEFWEFLVNGKSAEVGAGSYKLKDGDKIEWRISTF